MSVDWITLRDNGVNGDAGALEQLCLGMWPVAYRAAYLVLRNHADAEDVAQETTIRVIPHLLKCPTEQALRSYVYKAAHNRAIDILPPPPPEPLVDTDPPQPPHQGSDVTECLKKLTPLERQVIELHCLGYTNPEAAAMLSKTTEQIGQVKFGARKKIRTCLQKT